MRYHSDMDFTCAHPDCDATGTGLVRGVRYPDGNGAWVCNTHLNYRPPIEGQLPL